VDLKFGIPCGIIKRGGFHAKIVGKIGKVWETHGNTTINRDNRGLDGNII
jgi:hypothetical protein